MMRSGPAVWTRTGRGGQISAGAEVVGSACEDMPDAISGAWGLWQKKSWVGIGGLSYEVERLSARGVDGGRYDAGYGVQ